MSKSYHQDRCIDLGLKTWVLLATYSRLKLLLFCSTVVTHHSSFKPTTESHLWVRCMTHLILRSYRLHTLYGIFFFCLSYSILLQIHDQILSSSQTHDTVYPWMSKSGYISFRVIRGMGGLNPILINAEIHFIFEAANLKLPLLKFAAGFREWIISQSLPVIGGIRLGFLMCHWGSCQILGCFWVAPPHHQPYREPWDVQLNHLF